MGWDVEAGVRWMMQHSSMTREQAAAEVERYVAYPAQALSYKIGELKIRELRRRAEQELGPKFDLRAFHDQILKGGSMPLSVLEQGVDRWIAASRAECPGIYSTRAGLEPPLPLRSGQVGLDAGGCR
jgi:uncharacterized protein (DUF885 family)